MMHFAASVFSLSNRIPLRDRLTFSPTRWSPPTSSSTQAESERSKCFKIAAWPHHRGGARTLRAQSYCISPLGIVRIHKLKREGPSDYWKPTMPSVVAVNFWLRGPGLDSSGLRWGVGSGAEYLTFLRDDSLVTTLFVLRASPPCGSPVATLKSDADDKYFPGPSVSADSTPCSQTWAWAEVFDPCQVWIYSSGSCWT